MPPKAAGSLADELVKALQDESVRAIIGNLFEDKLKPLLETVAQLKQESEQQAATIANLSDELSVAKERIEELEAYNRRENLIITGLPLANAAEASATPSAESDDATSRRNAENSATTEKLVLELCQQQLNLPLAAADISIAHRLRTKSGTNGPPPVIVRFTNRKARDAVFAARCQLKTCPDKIFVNEDLTATASNLFFKARKLVTDKVVYKAWTNRGSVYIKEANNTASKPKLIRSASDLPHA